MALSIRNAKAEKLARKLAAESVENIPQGNIGCALNFLKDNGISVVTIPEK